MSDHHKMIVTVIKTTFMKANPRVITYRSYKHFDRVNFRKELKNKLYSHTDNINKYQQFESVFLNVLEGHDPLKKKTVRANEAPYMSKALRKAIATRSRLENIVHRKCTEDIRERFKKQKDYCSRLYKKEGKKFYSNLDPKSITDTKRFWQTMKPFFQIRVCLNVI